MPYLWLFFFLFVLSNSDVINFLLLYFLFYTLLLSHISLCFLERKRVDPDGRAGVEELRSREWGIHNQDIVCETVKHFQ